MKFLFTVLIIGLVSCSYNFLDQGEKMYEIKLRDHSDFKLTFIGGGATAPSSIWVSKKTAKNEEVIIDRIVQRFDAKAQVKVIQLNDSLVKLILSDSSAYFSPKDSFLINLNQRIYPNDGYLGAESLR